MEKPKVQITLNVTTVIQALAWLAAVGQLLLDSPIPEHWRPRIMVAVAIISLTLHRFAGSHNPDGRPVALPYTKPRKLETCAAEAAYEAYRVQAGGRSMATGAPLPPWSEIAPQIQDAWRAAAGAAVVSRRPL